MNFVLDASVALSWAFEDEGGTWSGTVLRSLGRSEAITPSLWPLEIANGLLAAERRKRITRKDAAEYTRLLLALPIVVEPIERAGAFRHVHPLARVHGLSAYDGAYLELATRQGIPIATLDERLRSAARAEGVGVYGD